MLTTWMRFSISSILALQNCLKNFTLDCEIFVKRSVLIKLTICVYTLLENHHKKGFHCLEKKNERTKQHVKLIDCTELLESTVTVKRNL